MANQGSATSHETVGCSRCLKRKRSASDDSDVDDMGSNDSVWIDAQGSESDGVESIENADSEDGDGEIVLPERRMRREDLAWWPPPSSTLCCVTCNAMTGTADGLLGLLDERGYKHLSWYDIQERASQGCSLWSIYLGRH